jgi:hypothetical protein
LRARFGEEMELVFEEQMGSAWRDGGVPAAVQVWKSALTELATIALPSRLAPVAVPAIAIATAIVWFVGVGLIPLARAR